MVQGFALDYSPYLSQSAVTVLVNALRGKHRVIRGEVGEARPRVRRSTSTYQLCLMGVRDRCDADHVLEPISKQTLRYAVDRSWVSRSRHAGTRGQRT